MSKKKKKKKRRGWGRGREKRTKVDALPRYNLVGMLKSTAELEYYFHITD